MGDISLWLWACASVAITVMVLPSLVRPLVVTRGLRLLDRQRPGWESAINTDTLDIRSSERCVLGQIYGHYVYGLDRLRIHDGMFRGFIGGPRLTQAWIDVIQQRRAEKRGLLKPSKVAA